MATAFGSFDFDKQIISWATRNGFTFDEKSRQFTKNNEKVSQTEVMQAMQQAMLIDANMALMPEGYSLSESGAVLKDGVQTDDNVASRILDQINERREMMSKENVATIASERGWTVSTSGQMFSKDGVTINLEKMTLMLLSEGAFKTEKEKLTEKRQSVLTDLDLIKDAGLKNNPNIERQRNAIDQKLKAQQRKRLMYLGGAVLAVGLAAASGGLLAPVAGAVVSGATVAGSALTTLTLGEIGVATGIGLAAGLGTGYGITAFHHFSDPHHAAAKISLKLAKHKQRVDRFEKAYANDPTPENKKRLEKALKQENQYAAKQIAKMEKRRAKLEKKADKKLENIDTLHGKLFGYEGFVNKNLENANLYKQITKIMEDDIQNNLDVANLHNLDVAATRGKIMQDINNAYSQTGKITTIELQESDMENDEMVKNMINDDITANPSVFAKVGSFDAVLDKLVADGKITEEKKQNMSIQERREIALQTLVAFKKSGSALDLDSAEVRDFMQETLEKALPLLGDESAMSKMTRDQQNVLFDIFSSEEGKDITGHRDFTKGIDKNPNMVKLQEIARDLEVNVSSEDKETHQITYGIWNYNDFTAEVEKFNNSTLTGKIYNASDHVKEKAKTTVKKVGQTMKDTFGPGAGPSAT